MAKQTPEERVSLLRRFRHLRRQGLTLEQIGTRFGYSVSGLKCMLRTAEAEEATAASSTKAEVRINP